MSDVVLQIVAKLIFAGCVILVCKRSFHWTMRSVKKWMLTMLFLAVSIGSSFLPDPFNQFAFLLMPIPFLCLAEGKLFDSWLNILIVQFGLELFQFVFLSIKVLVVGLEKDSAIFYVCINLLLLAGALFLTSRKSYQTGAGEFKSVSAQKRVFILGLMLAADVMAAVGSVVRNEIGGEIAIAFFCIIMIFILIGIVGVLVWLLVESHTGTQYKEQSRLKEEIIVSQKMYYQAMLEKARELRAFRHDIGNQLGVLSILYEKGDHAEFQKQLNRLLSDYNNTGMRYVSVGDEVIDAILNAELEKAARLGIRFQVDGRVENSGNYDLYDLCAIFSNTVRNAVEACEKRLQDAEINVIIKMHNGSLYYRIENPATEEDYQNLKSEKTSKDDDDHHGFGVTNVRRAVERVNGRMECHYGDGRLILEIFA